tara:strand:- start:447 stop:848 length:402 start_codon:yes stop_codon:yes gene_type:complete
MNKCIDDNLTDLNLISLLAEGVKISVRQGRIVHEQAKGENIVTNVASSFKRWFFNDNRKSGVNEMYAIVKQAIQILDADEKALKKNSFYYNKYIEILPKVIDGIDNYKLTYKEDAYITSRCNVIIDGINSVPK